MTPGYLNCPVVLICMCMVVRAKLAMAIEPQLAHSSENENVFNEKILARQSNSEENSFSSSTLNNANLEILENDLAQNTDSPSRYSEKSVDDDNSSKNNANDEAADDTSNEDNYYVTDAIEKRPSVPVGYTSQLGKRDTVEYGFNDQPGKRPQAGLIVHFGRRTPLGFVSQLGKRAHMGFISQLGKRSPLGFYSQLGKRAPPQMDFINTLASKAPLGFYSQLGKRAPMGYVSQLGKRSEGVSFIFDNSDNSKEHKFEVRKRRASALPWIFARRQDVSNQLTWTNNKSRSSMDTSFDKQPNGNISFFPQLGKRVAEDDYMYSDK